MEIPTKKLEVFSEILLQEYIRLMTVAVYIQDENNITGVKFRINSENYNKLLEYPLQSGLIGLECEFKDDILTVIPQSSVLQQYNNKILKQVVLEYYDAYKTRYSDYINIIE